MSCWAACNLAPFEGRRWGEVTSLLDLGLPGMPDQETVHDRHLSVHQAREHEHVLDAMQKRLDQTPNASRLRRQTVEHAFGTLKAWMGSTHFLTKTLPKVRTEMSLHVLAYNMKRAISILGVQPLIEFMKT